MTALTHSRKPTTATTAVSNLTFCSPNITQALSNNLSAKKLIENYPLQHDFKEEFIDTLHSKNLLDTNYQLILERITTQFPNLDIEEIKAIVDMLIKPRLINIYEDKEKTRIAAIASFSWIELFRYLKMSVPDIASIELFGSRLPSFLVETIQKVAQTLTQDPNYQLPSKLLNHFLGTPADTDYLISLPLSTPERFEEFKNIFAHFIAQKACLNNPSLPFNDMKNYVTEYSFFKRNVPKAAYANMFALFSLKEANTQEISEFVVSQKQNEFALLQDDFSLPLDAIIEAFPEHIFANMQQTSSTTQELLNAEKEAIFEKIQNNAFELPKIQSREDKLWQVAFDLLVGHLSAPENSSESSQRILRVLLKYSIGKCSIDKELESLTIGKLKITADNWPANQCSLPRNLDAKLTDLVADPSKDTQANKVAAIIAYELERYFHTHSLGFNALVSMLWHCSMMLQREKVENAIIPLWDNMHGCICNLRSKKDMRNFHTFSLWETISQIMDEATSPKHFKNLQNLLQQNVFFSRVPLDVDFTLDQGILSFKISEDNYSLRLPVSQSKVPDIIQLSPSFEPLITPKLPESHIPYLASQVIGKGSFQSKMTALKILHSYTDESKQEAWKIIKASMLKLIEHTKNPEEILLLMKTALKCHLKREQDCEALFSSCTKNTSPYLMWAHILLSLSDKKADTDITTAYHLWAKYREKDPMARNFPFEWAMIKKMASYKPHLAIPLFYSLEETGYQNDEQSEIFAWLQLLLTDNSFEREKFLSLIPAETQLSFIDFFVVKNSRDLNFLLNLRTSLSNTCEQQFLNLIDQKLISFALDEKEIDIDFKPLADICALAIKTHLLPEAETIILRLLTIKKADDTTLTDLITLYCQKANHQKTGYQNKEQEKLFAWLLTMLKDNKCDQKKFSSLIPLQTQFSFINFVVKNSSNSNLELNFLLDLRASLSDTYETQTLNLIDQKLISFALDEKEIDNIDFKPLADICALAIQAHLLPEAETIILKLLKKKNADTTLLANLVCDHFKEADHENDAKKLLNNTVIEKLLFQVPEEAMAGLLHIQQLKNAKTSSETTKTALRIYLQIFHESKNSINLDCTPCLPTVQEILNEKAKLADALKKSIQNSHQELLDAALKPNETHSTDFCSLFFGFLQKQVSTGITKDHILKIVQYLDNEEISKQFLPYEQQLIKIYPPLADLNNLKKIHNLQFKENLISYLCAPTKNALKNLCVSLKQQNYDIQEVLTGSSFLTEFSEEKIQEMLNAVAQNIYENRTFLKSIPESDNTSKTIHLAFKIWKGFQNTFYKEHPNFQKDYSHNDLLMQVLIGFNDETSLPTEAVCKSLSLDLIQDKNFLRAQVAAITEMNEHQYFLYFLSVFPAFIQKLAKSEKDQHHKGYQFLKDLIQQIPFKCGLKLAETFCFELEDLNSKIAAHSALIMLEELFKRPLNAKEEKKLEKVGSKILEKIIWKHPNQMNRQILNFLCNLRESISYICASRFLALIMLQAKIFPEEILNSFLEIEQQDISLADRHFQLFKHVVSIKPKSPNNLIRYVQSLHWINKTMIKEELSIKKINIFIATAIALGFADFADSCFDIPNQDIYEEYLKIVRDILNDPQLKGTSYRGTNCLALGMPYTAQSWIREEKSGERFPMTLEQMNHVIDYKIDCLINAALNPTETSDPAKTSNPLAYAKFRQVAAMLENGFHDFFKNRYPRYLAFVNQLTRIAVSYADKENFFETMNAIILELYCKDDPVLTLEDRNVRKDAVLGWFKQLASLCNLNKKNYSKYLNIVNQLTQVTLLHINDKKIFNKLNTIILDLYFKDDPALTPEDKSARGNAIFKWCMQLAEMNHPSADLASAYILAETEKRGISVLMDLTYR